MDGRRQDSRSEHGRTVVDRLAARVSRRGLIAGGGLAGVGLLASQLEMLRSAAQDAAAVAAIIDPLATLEAFAVTFAGLGRQQGDKLKIGADAARFLRAAQCEDE